MPYPEIPDFYKIINDLNDYAALRHEQGAKGVPGILARTEKLLRKSLKEMAALKPAASHSKNEPDGLSEIRGKRPRGPRRIWQKIDEKVFEDRLAGALLGRMAGCILGSPVEFWSIEQMANLARETGDSFPPRDYWSWVPDPFTKRYGVSERQEYTRGRLKNVPVDDDIIYTLLGLLILEDHGPDFGASDVGRAWLKYLPYACTAEDIALKNLKKKISAEKAGLKDNPYIHWIGADIRSDPWAYAAPGWPERAAEYAWRDAMLSHRGSGLHGEMYFSAAISAAFTVTDPVRALEIGLTEIPAGCALAADIKWALKSASRIRDYRQAREAVDKRFKGMSGVHTNNNACLTVFGITIGGRNFTRVIGETVAMGLDNDCTAATAGSLVGAVIGRRKIPAHWYKCFRDTIISYLKGKPRFSIFDTIRRFQVQARQSFS